MKANELRIGNWVRWHYKGGFVDAPVLHLEDGEDLNVLPIPLTPEILEKCGFEKVTKQFQDNWVLGKWHSIKLRDGEWWFSDDTSDANCYNVAKVEYLHQLQNLFYCLTGEELNIEL